MLENQLAAKYAQAVFQLAQEKNLIDEVEKQLETVEKAIKDSSEFTKFFYNPGVAPAGKIETLKKIFTGEVDDFVLNFLVILADRRREMIIPAIVKEYKNFHNEAKGIVEAKVTVVNMLTSDEAQALTAKLSKITGKQVILNIREDKSIMGGVIVQIGDKLIDGSVVRQIKMMKAALLNIEANKIGVTN